LSSVRWQEGSNMALKITNREVNGAFVLALEGRIVLGAEGDALREELHTLVHDGKKKLVLNMDHIEYIDSAGLGTLIEAHLNAKSQGASLKLCHLCSKLQEVLQITRLATVFQVCNTEAVAVASFSV
jgi:anti-sigma B factor antagonist